jgi:D-serine deaminase-like pyridoxal phosphate-dependent protein
MAEAAIDTPALLLDLNAFERNLVTMAQFADRAGVQLRPHAKTHKCAAIAEIQIEHGAVGVCVQKTEEACALAAAGIDDIFVSNQIVGAAKCKRLAELAKRVRRLAVAVDDLRGIDDLGAAVQAADSRLDVFVEIDVGQHRCGVAPGRVAVELAQAIGARPGLRFAGLQAYQGSAQHIRDPRERAGAIGAAIDLVHLTREALRDAGLPCPRVTGAGTGSFVFEAASGTFDELQVGSYVFMDADYSRNGNLPNALQFEQSLFVLTTVISRAEAHVVVDAGLKAHSTDSGLPLVVASGWRYAQASDEHGKLLADAALGAPVSLDRGAQIRLIPGHCDPTVNLHDWIVGVRNDVVESVWPIDARGALG